MNFGLVYDNRVYMTVTANDEASAWDEIRKAGVMNRSRQFKLRKMNFSREFEPDFSCNVMRNVVGCERLSIPTKSSVEMRR